MAVSSVATNSHLAGGVYRARTYDLHDVKAPSRWSGTLEMPLIKDDDNIIVCWFKRMKRKGFWNACVGTQAYSIEQEFNIEVFSMQISKIRSCGLWSWEALRLIVEMVKLIPCQQHSWRWQASFRNLNFRWFEHEFDLVSVMLKTRALRWDVSPQRRMIYPRPFTDIIRLL